LGLASIFNVFYTLEGAKNKLKSSKEIFEVVKKLEKIKSKLINIEKEL
jgi:hypothetical protein